MSYYNNNKIYILLLIWILIHLRKSFIVKKTYRKFEENCLPVSSWKTVGNQSPPVHLVLTRHSSWWILTKTLVFNILINIKLIFIAIFDYSFKYCLNKTYHLIILNLVTPSNVAFIYSWTLDWFTLKDTPQPFLSPLLCNNKLINYYYWTV